MKKNTYKWASLAFLLGFVLLISQCGRPYRPGKNTAPIQDKEKILLLDHGLTYYINVVRQATNRLEGGQLEVKVALENEEDKDVWVDIQTEFRGDDGFEVEKTTWEPILLHRRTITTYKKNSLKTSAADYRISIRNIKSK